MSAGFRTVRLDELPHSRTDGRTVTLVRRELGIESFGINAFGADAGKPVVFPHTELTDVTFGHEEVYLVLKGRARFEIDGETIDAPTGTLVHVGDPALTRSAVAEEDGTTVLAVGAPIGKAFEPAPWEWSRASAGALASGNAEEAARIAEDGLRRFPDNERLTQRLAEARTRLA